jgi:acetylornithine deacetylase/succinyl-diaminopimelate desuccinylase-like protein
MDLASEATEVLVRLIRCHTVNPPGDEREAQQWLQGYLEEAGFEVELAGAEPERPNLVARLRGDAPGPVLGYLSHMDTVLADAADWSRDPWAGDVADGFVWGRGALDMKGQTAAEVVGATALARSGWRPARGELRIICVVDEETGGTLGARWLTETRPDLARVDWLVNEGGGPAIPLEERRFHGVCCAEKGTFRFSVRTRGVAGHASVPGVGDNALPKLAPVLERLDAFEVSLAPSEEGLAFLSALHSGAPDDPEAALAALRERDERLAAMVAATLGVTMAPTRISASEKINVIPAQAELQVDCRVPPGMGSEEAMRHIRSVLDGADHEVEFLEQVVGNRSPIESPLMGAIGEWVGEQDPDATVVPVVLPAFTDSRWFRHAFPDCVAYGFFPQRHQTIFDTWPLMHGADERIDVRDLAWATEFFHWLPRRLLA